MTNNEVNENIEELFQSLLFRYQIGLETLMKGSNFIFDCIHLLYHTFHKQILNLADSPHWIENKKAKINPINKKDYVFLICCNSHANSSRNEKGLQRITKNQTFYR